MNSGWLQNHASELLILLPLIAGGLALLARAMGARTGPAERRARALPLLVYPLAGLVLASVLPDILQAPGTGQTVWLGGFVGEPGILLRLDGLAWVSSALIATGTLAVALAALSSPDFDLRFHFVLHITTAGMQSVVLTTDLFTMFVSFEIVAIGVYVLIAWERSSEGLLASLKYLMLSSVGILLFLIGVFFAYRDYGTLNLEVLASRMAGSTLDRSAQVMVACLVVGIGVRTAFIPFHTWLPEAHAWAPHPVSALLSGVLIKVSFLALTRVVTGLDAAALMPLLVWVGAITALVAVVWALAQHDAKRLLAYHSISQMGYILAAWAVATPAGAVASLAHAVSHALFKALLFLALGALIHRLHTRDLYRMRGVWSRAPLLASAVVVGSLAISGIPPFNGFYSKQLVSAAVAGHAAYPLLRLTAVGTMASFAKVLRILGPGGPDSGSPRPRSRGESTALVLLTLLVVGTGLAAPLLVPVLAQLTGADMATGRALAAYLRLSPDTLLETAGTAGLGLVLMLLVVSERGRSVGDRIAGLAPQLHTILIFMIAGLVLFVVAA